MSKRSTKFIGLLLAVVVAVSGIVTSHSAQASGLASGSGGITVGRYTSNLLASTKTLDLSEVTTGIHITQADVDALDEYAKQLTTLWFYATSLIFLDDSYDKTSSYSDANAAVISKYETYKKYWYNRTWDAADFTLTDTQKQFLSTIAPFSYDELVSWIGDSSNFNTEEKMVLHPAFVLSASEGYGKDPYVDANGTTRFIWRETGLFKDNYDSNSATVALTRIADVIIGKYEEIYNDVFSDFLVEQLSQALNTQVDFAIQPLASDGSEDAAYGIGGDVARGALTSDALKIATVDFGAPDQFYDQVLMEGVSFAEAVSQRTNTYVMGELRLKDRRDLGEHIFAIDGGALHASDGSKFAYTYPRDDSNHPGFTSLLDVVDSLDVYTVYQLSIPSKLGYSGYFNLLLNPAVSYYFDLVDTDLITDVTFDANGDLATITKPIRMTENADQIAASNPTDGTYRFKLIETEIRGDWADQMATDTSDKYLDVTIKNGAVETFDITMGIGGQLVSSYPYASMGNVNETTLEDGATFTNVVGTIDITATKTWDDESDKDGLRPSAEDFAKKLHLYAVDEKEKTEITSVAPTVVDIGNDTYSITWAGLRKYKNGNKDLAEYTVEEDAIDGYETPVISGSVADGFAITNKHTPAPRMRAMKISKTDLAGYELNGASITVYDAEDAVVDAWVSGEEPHEITVEADAVYTFHEEVAPFGYETVTDVQFTVSEDSVVTVLNVETNSDYAKAEDDTLVITDSRDMTDTKPYYITKVDEKGNPLAGAKMQLKDKNGNITDEWTTTTEPHRIDIKPSDYFIVEIAAPSGYDKIADIHIETNDKAEVTILRDTSNAAYIEESGRTIEVTDLPTGYVPPTPVKTSTDTKPEATTPTTPKTTTTITPTSTATTKTATSPKTGVEDYTALYLGLSAAAAYALLLLLKKRRA